jgi:hypothetical protein
MMDTQRFVGLVSIGAVFASVFGIRLLAYSIPVHAWSICAALLLWRRFIEIIPK